MTKVNVTASVPEFKGMAPVWASAKASDTDSSIAPNGKPLATWSTDDIFSVENYSAAVIRDDEYDPATDITTAGNTVLAIYSDTSNPWVDDPDTARRIGFGILKAADRFEDIISENTSAPEVFHDLDGEVLNTQVGVGSVFPDVTIAANKEDDAFEVFISGLNGNIFTPSQAEFLCLEILRAAHIAEQLNSEVTR